jgi:DNA-binding PadR family transcriptional regulator
MNDLFLLANLLDDPKHGYALKKQVGLISGQEEMHNNLVYPLLRRFVESGWVRKRQGAGERGQTRESTPSPPRASKNSFDASAMRRGKR